MVGSQFAGFFEEFLRPDVVPFGCQDPPAKRQNVWVIGFT
jgi:hypothetical protein